MPKLKGIPVKGTLKDGKFIKADNAPTQVRQARRRKAGKVTGVKRRTA
jgi:translation elongation factor P/translation initiation factor 5A